MKTLIKTDNSLILVSDEEIKEGDKFYNGESILKCSRVTNILIDINLILLEKLSKIYCLKIIYLIR